MPPSFFSSRSAGWIALAVTIALWVTFAISTRAIAFSSLTTIDVAIIRYIVPILVLGFALPRSWKRIRQAPVASVLMIAIGAGLPFFWLTARGGQLSSATFIGVINPGVPPIFVALIGYILWKQRISGLSLLGYAGILGGVALMIMSAPATLNASGAIFLFLAALCWAIYTIGMQKSGLDPISAALLMSLPTAIVSIVIAVIVPGTSQILQAPASEIAGFVIVQGIGTGVVSTLGYALAIRHLGATTAATSAALSPVLTSMVAVPVFGEQLSMMTVLGIILVVIGIMAVSAGRRYRLRLSVERLAAATQP